MTALFAGFALGFFVAAQLGPISLLAIRSTLRSGVLVGLAIGAGVAVIDTLYAAAGAAGAAGLLAIEPLRLAFGAPRRGGADRARRAHAVERVPDPHGRRVARGARHAAGRVPDRARGHRLEPADDRLVGGGVRGRLDGRRRGRRRRGAAARRRRPRQPHVDDPPRGRRRRSPAAESARGCCAPSTASPAPASSASAACSPTARCATRPVRSTPRTADPMTKGSTRRCRS